MVIKFVDHLKIKIVKYFWGEWEHRCEPKKTNKSSYNSKTIFKVAPTSNSLSL